MVSHLRGPFSKEKYKVKRRDNETLEGNTTTPFSKTDDNRSRRCSQKQRNKRGNNFLNHHILLHSSNSVLYFAFYIILSLVFLLSICDHSDFHVHGFISSSTSLSFSDRSVHSFSITFHFAPPIYSCELQLIVRRLLHVLS